MKGEKVGIWRHFWKLSKYARDQKKFQKQGSESHFLTLGRQEAVRYA